MVGGFDQNIEAKRNETIGRLSWTRSNLAGFSFEVGVKDRRTVTRSNVDEVSPVPLFIKAPGQRRGRTSGAYVRTTDVEYLEVWHERQLDVDLIVSSEYETAHAVSRLIARLRPALPARSRRVRGRSPSRGRAGRGWPWAR